MKSEPFKARYNTASLWTGTHVVVWGGQQGEWPDRGQLVGDGAMWSPVERSWTRIPPAPVPARQSGAVTWAGGRLFVWGGTDAAGHRSDGAMYDPSAGWSMLPPAPLSPRFGAVAAEVGNEIFVIGGWDNLGMLDDGAAFNPTIGQWRDLPPLPQHYGESLRAVSTPRGLVLWAQNSYSGDGSTGARPLRFDRRSDRWRPLLRGAERSDNLASITAHRGDLYAVTANAPAQVLVLRRGRQEWEPLLTLREQDSWGQHLVAAGRYVYIVSITPALTAQRLDPRTMEWMPLARDTTPWQELTTVAWTGDQLVVRGLATDLGGSGAPGMTPKLMGWRPGR